MSSYVIGVKPDQAGPSVEFQTPVGSGASSPFGTTAYVGAFRWGPLSSAINHGNQNHYRAVRGEAIEGDFCALGAEHGFKLGGDSLNAITLRLTDGKERQAAVPVFQRLTHHGWRDAQPVASGYPWNVAFRLLGAFPGRRGGAKLRFGGVTVAALPTSGSSFDTELTGANWPYGKDETKGCTLHFEGLTATWEVVANDTAGGITVAGEFSGTPTGKAWWIARDNYGPTTLQEHVGARIEEDPVQSYLWRLISLRNGTESGQAYNAVGNDSTQKHYHADKITTAVNKLQELAVTVADDGFPEGADYRDERYKPASWVGWALEVTDTSATVQTMGYWRAATSEVYPDLAVTFDSMPSDAEPCQIRCIEQGGGLYHIEVRTIDGERVLIPAGLVTIASDGATLALRTKFGWLPNIALKGTPSVGDVHIYINPLPPNLRRRGGYLYPNALSSQGSIRTRLRLGTNTSTSFNALLAPGDSLTNYLTAPTAAALSGSVATAVALTKAETLLITDDAGTDKTLDVSALVGAGPFTQQAIAVALNTSAATEYGVASPPVEFDVDDDGFLRISTSLALGATATLTVKETGTLNASVGFDAVDPTTVTGAAGSTFVLSYDMQCEGGFDGIGALGEASEYEAALDTAASPLLKFARKQLGLVKVVTPGVADPDVINAGVALANVLGWRYVPTLPSNLTTQQAAIDWLLANIALTDSARALANMYYPSWGTLRNNPFGGADLLSPICSAALGLAASYAQRYQGYHRAVAGENADISAIFAALPTDERGEGVWIDDAPLNQVGIVAVQHDGPKIMLWGARSPEQGGSGTIWSHKWDEILHLGQMLRELSYKFAFAPIPDVWVDIKRFARDITRRRWRAGAWKGASFDEAFQITVDETNNPLEVQEAGRVLCTITALGVKDVSEQVRYIIGTTGVAVATL